MQSTLRLFKALPVETKYSGPIDSGLLRMTLKHGFIFAPDVSSQYAAPHLIDLVNQLYGRNPEQLNATFHKSFAKVRDASIIQLVLEQALHYLTTYGAERLGLYDQDSVFIPAELLDAPALEDGLRLVVIRGLTKAELKTELMKLLGSGVALHEQTVKDAVEVAQFVGMKELDLLAVRNREVRAALYDDLGIVPADPQEFMRFVIYRATGKTLVIKNADLITALRGRDNLDLVKYFQAYEQRVSLAALAKIFHRYKPIFLALRTNTALKKYVNRIRRLAVTHHEPMQDDLLNSLTGKLKNHRLVAVGELQGQLRGANTFRKIRLAYALKFRMTDADSILYRIRNGKSYAKDFHFDNKWAAQHAYTVVMDSIVADLYPKVAGKRIYIPPGLKYGLPATEKQFTGNLPSGTSVEVSENMVVGVHWENLPNHRVDLDLSLANMDGKIGWDGSYRDRRNGVFFSGDVTDAPRGATEVFHVGAQARGSWLVNLNYYNYRAETPVPFKIVVGQDSQRNVNLNYTIDPNQIVALSNSVIDVKQKTLGVLVADNQSTRFYFAEAAFQTGISSRHTQAAEQARQYLLKYYTDSIVLNDALELAGAKLVDRAEDADIDLSWEAIDRTTILNLIGSEQ